LIAATLYENVPLDPIGFLKLQRCISICSNKNGYCSCCSCFVLLLLLLLLLLAAAACVAASAFATADDAAAADDAVAPG
jgi:hypothetical protein